MCVGMGGDKVMKYHARNEWGQKLQYLAPQDTHKNVCLLSDYTHTYTSSVTCILHQHQLQLLLLHLPSLRVFERQTHTALEYTHMAVRRDIENLKWNCIWQIVYVENKHYYNIHVHCTLISPDSRTCFSSQMTQNSLSDCSRFRA